jgi:hypothetical protein
MIWGICTQVLIGSKYWMSVLVMRMSTKSRRLNWSLLILSAMNILVIFLNNSDSYKLWSMKWLADQNWIWADHISRTHIWLRSNVQRIRSSWWEDWCNCLCKMRKKKITMSERILKNAIDCFTKSCIKNGTTSSQRTKRNAWMSLN